MRKLLTIAEFIFHGTGHAVKLALTLIFKNLLGKPQWKTSQQSLRELDSPEVTPRLLKPGRVKAGSQI